MLFQSFQRKIQQLRGFFIYFLDGLFGRIRLQKEIFQWNGFYGLMDFPVGVKYTFSDGKINAFSCKLADFVGSAVETMDDPRLFGLVFFMEIQDIGGGSHIMDNQRLLVFLGKEDMLFENLDLKGKRVFVKAVDPCFTDGDNLRGQI